MIMTGACFCVCLMGLYYTLLYSGVKIELHRIKVDVKTWRFFTAASLAVVAFCCLFLYNEHFIYYWDYGSYWYQSVWRDYLSLPVKELAGILMENINHSEYNLLPAMLVLLPLKLCGNSYAAFVLLCIVLFYIPNALMMFLTVQVALDRVGASWDGGHQRGIVTACLCFSSFLVPVLSGYVDIVCCPVLTLLYYLVIARRDFEKLDWKRDTVMGLCVFMLLLLRRTFSYAILGGAAFILPCWLIEKKGGWKKAQTALFDMVIVVVPPFMLTALLFSGLFRMYFFNNYSEAYSAYKSLGFWQEWPVLVKYFGVLTAVFVLAAPVFAKSFEQRKLTYSLVFSVIFTAAVFYMTQDMGQQHYYVILFQILLLFILGFVLLEERLSLPALRKTTEYLFLFVLLVNFCTQFGIALFHPSALFVSNVIKPRTRNDIKQIQALDYKVDELILGGYEGVYCTASSFVINSDICNKAFGADSPLHFTVYAADVDLRDGFNTAFLDADIVIATDTVQTHLPQGQELIHILNSLFSEEAVFSENYEKVGSYMLDEGVLASIWVKTEPLTRSDIVSVEELFTAVYPDYPELFYDRFEAYLLEKEL